VYGCGLRGEEIKLTPTEFALLEQFVTNPGKLLTHRLLLQRVWGPEYGDEAEYLRVYIGRLRRKLEQDPADSAHVHHRARYWLPLLPTRVARASVILWPPSQGTEAADATLPGQRIHLIGEVAGREVTVARLVH
jgi:hypothetical protein